jgi:hypothetical protein
MVILVVYDQTKWQPSMLSAWAKKRDKTISLRPSDYEQNIAECKLIGILVTIHKERFNILNDSIIVSSPFK